MNKILQGKDDSVQDEEVFIHQSQSRQRNEGVHFTTNVIRTNEM